MRKISVLGLAFCLGLALTFPALAAEEGRPAEYGLLEGTDTYAGPEPLTPVVGEQENAAPAASGPAGAREAAPFANAFELYESWYANAKGDELSVYPEAVCGVWSTDGTMDRLTIAVTKDEAGEACKEEILSQVEDTSTLTFTYQTYTYLQLRQIQEELTSRLGDETGAQGIGVHEMENRVVIDIDTANENAQAFIDWCAVQYGDQVGFEGSDGLRIMPATDMSVPGMMPDRGGGAADTGRIAWMWLLCTAGVLAAALLLNRRRRAVLLARADGGTRSAAPLTRGQTARLVREGNAAPDPRLLEEIMKKLGPV